MDSGILYWFLSRTRDRNANNIAFNGSTTFAQSNDIVAKTAYNGTVSGNVTIGSDGDGSYFNFNNGAIDIADTNDLDFPGGQFTIQFVIKLLVMPASTSSIFTKNTANFEPYRFEINSVGGGQLGVAVNGSNRDFLTFPTSTFTTSVLYNVQCVFNAGYMAIYLNGSLLNSKTSVLVTSIRNVTTALTLGLSRGIYFNSRIYGFKAFSTALNPTELATELALGQKNTARKDCVLEILPNYFAGTTASPTTIYDVKAFTPATPVVIQTTFQLGADGVDTTNSQPIIDTPYFRFYDRRSDNNLNTRFDNSGSRVSEYLLGSGNRSNHTAVASISLVNGSMVTSLFVDGVKRDTDTFTVIPATKYSDYILLGKYGLASAFFTGVISNTKVYIGTITDDEGETMSSGIPVTPVNATVFTQPRRLPPYGTTMTDVSGNGYDFTLTP